MFIRSHDQKYHSFPIKSTIFIHLFFFIHFKTIHIFFTSCVCIKRLLAIFLNVYLIFYLTRSRKPTTKKKRMATVQRKLVHKQFNSPIGLYSESNVKSTLNRELKAFSNGTMGWVFFNYVDRSVFSILNIAIYRLVCNWNSNYKWNQLLNQTLVAFYYNATKILKQWRLAKIQCVRRKM